jgi:hypothetical protein
MANKKSRRPDERRLFFTQADGQAVAFVFS